jgi:hypothetical protein
MYGRDAILHLTGHSRNALSDRRSKCIGAERSAEPSVEIFRREQHYWTAGDLASNQNAASRCFR